MGGVAAPLYPKGVFTPVDVTVNNVTMAEIVLEGQNIPIGTTVSVTVIHETEGTSVLVSPPLNGTKENSSATVGATFQPGFSQIITHAKWGP